MHYIRVHIRYSYIVGRYIRYILHIFVLISVISFACDYDRAIYIYSAQDEICTVRAFRQRNVHNLDFIRDTYMSQTQ